jgi:hypothetical protein
MVNLDGFKGGKILFRNRNWIFRNSISMKMKRNRISVTGTGTESHELKISGTGSLI